MADVNNQPEDGMFKSESEVGEIVKAYLEDCGAEVYCEVDSGIGRIDIVAVTDKILTSVELKARLSLDVLGQAIERSPYVHRSVAAFPMPKNRGHKEIILRAVHEQYGIGIWCVSENRVEEKYAPRLHRSSLTRYVRDSLREEQKGQSAGVNSNFWSPFQDTKQGLIRFVRKNPGCTLKQAMTEVKHHYSSHSTAYNSMGAWIRQGVIKEITRRNDGLHLSES